MSALGGVSVGTLPEPHARCKACADLATEHASAERKFNWSEAVDARIRMRRHQQEAHR